MINDGRLTAVVLAAGQGTRMRSESARPKVLYELAGRAMVHYVVEAALVAGAFEVVVVVGHGREEVTRSLAIFGDRVRTAVQEKQGGTGDAVRCALPSIDPSASRALLLCGDTPLLEPSALESLAGASRTSALALLSMKLDDPTGYGRIVRSLDDGRLLAIREHRDCSADELRIREVNAGVYVAELGFLRKAIHELRSDNAQGELYLTDIVALAERAGGAVAEVAKAPGSLVGINDRAQLAAAEEVMYARIADDLRRAGATIRAGVRVDFGVVVEPDATLEHGVVLRGKTRIGKGARIDVGCVLTDVEVAPLAVLKPYSVAQSSTIGEAAQIGPFSHLRPESEIHAEAHVGNFVETKKTVMRRGSKANHLAYLGDGDVGERANVGAGTIFCNYDGFRKHKTTIGADAFIGSDSQIVAPVTIGEGAYVATGTTVVDDVPADALAIGRVKQSNKAGYAGRLRGRLKALAAAAKK